MKSKKKIKQLAPAIKNDYLLIFNHDEVNILYTSVLYFLSIGIAQKEQREKAKQLFLRIEKY